MIKALVFDFDGLILDTEEPEYRAWCELYAEHGCTLALDTWAVCIGTHDVFDPVAELARQLGRAVDAGGLAARQRARSKELVRAQAILPGVREYLAEARAMGLKLGVASSSSRAWVAGHLAANGLLDAFDALRCRDDVTRVKPDPELYLACVRSLGVAPAEALAIEDSPNGVRAAHAAGLACLAVPNAITGQLDLSAADWRAPSLAELPLRELLARADGGARA